MITLPFDQYHAMRAQMYQTACISSRSAGSASFWAIADHAMKDGGYVCGPEPGSDRVEFVDSTPLKGVVSVRRYLSQNEHEKALAAARKEERERVLMFLETFAMDCYEERSEANDFVDAFRAALEKEDT